MADASLGSAVLHVKLDQAQLKTGLAQAEQATTKAASNMADKLAGVGKNLQGIGAKLSIGLTAPLTAIGVAGLRSAMQLETFSASLNVLIGDTNRAQAAFDELYEFSANAPFSWESLTEGTRVLAAFGTEAEDLVPTLSMLGDVAAGVQTPIEDLTEAYGRMQLTGRVATLDLQRLASRGIPIYTELGRVLGKTEGEVQELVSAGKVGFPAVEQAFRNMTSEGGKFYGMMAAQSDTVAGRVNRLKDSFSQVTDIVGQRLIPIFDKLVGAAQKATEWFINLDEGTQGIFVGLGIALAAAGPLLAGFGTLLVMLPKLVAGFNMLKTSALGANSAFGIVAVVLTAAAVAYTALSRAMDAGSGSRKASQDSFDDLVGSMESYRQSLVITSEAERTAALEALNRQKRVLEVTIQNQQAFIKSVEADVIAFANKGFFGQLFSFGAANVDIKTLDQAESQLRTLQTQLKAVDGSIEKVSTMPIPGPTSDVPNFIKDLNAATTAANNLAVSMEGIEIPDPAADAKRWAARLTAELRFGIKDAGEVFALLQPRVEELREQATAALSEFGIDSEQYQDTVAKLEAIESLMERVRDASTTSLNISPMAQVATPQALSINPTAVVNAGTLRSINTVQRELEDAQRRKDAADVTSEAFLDASAEVTRLQEELSRLRDGVKLSADAFAVLPEKVTIPTPEPIATVAAPVGLSITPAAQVADEGLRSIAQVRAELQAAQRTLDTAGTELGRAVARALRDELQAELDRLQREGVPVALSIEPSANVAAAVGLGITPTATIGGMSQDEWSKFQKAQEEAAEKFRDTVISAGIGFTDTLVQGIQSGDLGSIIKGGFGAGGNILGSLVGGPWGMVISGLLPILGGLLGGLAGGDRDAEKRRRDEQQRARASVPAINLNFNVQQTNNYQGGPRDPTNELAFSRQADSLFESFYTRVLSPRLDRLERAAGIAAGA